jgi:serralysin
VTTAFCQINGGSGTDTVDYSLVTTSITVDLRIHTAQDTGGGGIDVIVGVENVIASFHSAQLIGNNVANELTSFSGTNSLIGLGGNDALQSSSSGDDTLNGGTGDDVLWASRGSDRLIGGDGADTFQYRDILDSGLTVSARDTIVDFLSGTDTMDLSVIDARKDQAGDQAFTFIGHHAFTGQDGELRYATGANGNSIVSGDVDGDKVADFAIRLIDVPLLTADDFIL